MANDLQFNGLWWVVGGALAEAAAAWLLRKQFGPRHPARLAGSICLRLLPKFAVLCLCAIAAYMSTFEQPGSAFATADPGLTAAKWHVTVASYLSRLIPKTTIGPWFDQQAFVQTNMTSIILARRAQLLIWSSIVQMVRGPSICRHCFAFAHVHPCHGETCTV